MKNFINENKKALFVSLFILIFMLIIGIIYTSSRKNQNSNEIPKIAINSEEIEIMNKYIKEIEEEFKNDSNYSIKYDKYEDSKYISLLIEVSNNKFEPSIPTYISYVIDKKTKKILTKEEIAELYNTSIKNINEKVIDRFKKYYKDESKLGYIEPREYSFETYLSLYRNIESIDNNYSLIIKNNELIAYIGFDRNSFFDDYEYFKKIKNPFEIKIS